MYICFSSEQSKKVYLDCLEISVTIGGSRWDPSNYYSTYRFVDSTISAVPIYAESYCINNITLKINEKSFVFPKDDYQSAIFISNP